MVGKRQAGRIGGGTATREAVQAVQAGLSGWVGSGAPWGKGVVAACV